MADEPDPRWIFYLCISGQGRKTYTGVTTNPERRLRCHRGEIKNGARWPLSWRDGVFYALYIKGLGTKRRTMSFEAHTKKRMRKKKLDAEFRCWLKYIESKYNKKFPRHGVIYRILTIMHVLTLPKWRDANLEVLWFHKKDVYQELERYRGECL